MEAITEITLTDTELLRVFPEAKDILNAKIKDWNRIKGKVFCKEVQPALKIISKAKDEFSLWFFKEAYKLCYLPERYKLALANLERLKRLKLIATKPKYASKVEDRQRNKLIAKEAPILNLYSFQKLRKVGSRYQALCPFHSDTAPSFVIYPDNSFHCFGCQANGDAIDFVKLLKDCNYNEAVGELAGVSQ